MVVKRNNMLEFPKKHQSYFATGYTGLNSGSKSIAQYCRCGCGKIVSEFENEQHYRNETRINYERRKYKY